MVFELIGSALIQNILAVALIYYQVLYVNRITIRNRLANEITLLPGLLYAILVSFLPEYSLLTPHLIANTFILICIGQIFKIYKKPKVADILFDVGFLIAFAGLFVSNYIVLLIVGIIGLAVLRSLKPVEIFQLLSGTILLGFAFCSILFLTDVAILPELNKISLVPRLAIIDLDKQALTKVAFFFCMAVFVVISYSSYTLKKSIQSQKKINILYWFMIATLFLFFFSASISSSLVLLFCIPSSILLSLSFVNIKSMLVQEVIHIVVLALLLALNFGVI